MGAFAWSQCPSRSTALYVTFWHSGSCCTTSDSFHSGPGEGEIPVPSTTTLFAIFRSADAPERGAGGGRHHRPFGRVTSARSLAWLAASFSLRWLLRLS